MSCLEENLSVIKKIRPNLYDKLEEIIESGIYSYDNIEETSTRDGNKALIIEKDNNKYRLNSIYKPLSEAEKWAGQYNFNNLSVSVVMFGIGNCLFVREMLKRLQNDAVVYLYEPDISIFLYDLNNIDITDILKEEYIYLFIEKINEEEFRDLLQENMDWSLLPTQIICSHPIYDKIYDDEYLEFMKSVYDANNLAKVNRDTEKHMSVTLAENAIRNLAYIKESNYVSEIIGKIPKDIPAIIVAAGPSLDKNIDELKRAEGKSFIMATDTSVKYLLAHNINFDAIITIDALKSITHLQDERCHNAPLFCVLEARNTLMDMHTGRKIWFRGSIYMYDLYDKFNRIFPSYNSGGSVATAAFSVCVSMGFKNIIFIGQDLAYSGGITHAGGVVKNILGDEDGRQYVDSVDGGQVMTRYDWLIYLEWFENSVRDLKELNVIDATEGGALIHGTKVMKLSEVIDEYCNNSFSFKGMLDELPYTFTGEEYNKVKDKISHLKKEFINIRQKSKEGIKLAEDVIRFINIGKCNTSSESKKLKQINKINNFLSKQDAYSILDIYITNMVADDVNTVNSLTDDEDENMKKTIEISVTIYKALIQAADALEPVLEDTLAKL
jgi:Uncharacterized protein conserved in bacteria